MKNPTPSSANPRFTCQIVRFTRALLENGGSGHVASCADCQAFYRAADQLETALRRDAFATRELAVAESSPGLERSIMRAVREAKLESEPAASRLAGWMWTGSGIAAAAVAAVFVFHQPTQSSHPVNVSSDDELAVVDVVENLSMKLTQMVIPKTGEMVANNPLQRELGSVYTDARSALDFLALNFLPGSTAASTATPKPATAI